MGFGKNHQGSKTMRRTQLYRVSTMLIFFFLAAALFLSLVRAGLFP
jgi:hypothetical protein